MSKSVEFILTRERSQTAVQCFPIYRKGLGSCQKKVRSHEKKPSFEAEAGFFTRFLNMSQVGMFFWSCLAIFSVGSAIVFFGCSQSSPSLHLNSSKPLRSLWVWDAAVITDLKEQQQFFVFCSEEDISLIYQDVGNCFTEPKVGSSKVQVSKASLANFISMAHDRGIKVHALDGDASWAHQENHSIPLDRLRCAFDFNLSVEPEKRLDGFQFDIEPYLLPEFRTDEWKAVLVEYLELVSQMQDKVRESNPNLELGFAIPFWWDVENTQVSEVDWQEASKPVAYHLIDILSDLQKSYIAIMDYRDFTDGPDGSIRHASDEMKYASENAPNVRVFIGQETGDVKPPKITFWQEGEDTLEEAISELMAAFNDSNSFGGIAIHHYGSYRQLKAKKEQSRT